MSTTTKSNSTSQSQATQTPTNPAWVTQPLQDLTSRISSLGNADPASYVAGQSPLQLQANSQGASTLQGTNPNFTAASGLINGNSSLDPSTIASWMNPYTHNVIDSTNALFDQNAGVQRAQQEAQGAANGAFGGSRFGVQQGVLAGQQGLARGNIDANLLNTGYDTAVSNAFQNKNLGLTAGGLLSNLGTAEDTSNRSNIGLLAGLGAGQQATAQAKATAPIALAQAMAQLFGQSQFGLFHGEDLSGTSATQSKTTTTDPLAILKGIFGLAGSAASGAGSLVNAFAPGGGGIGALA